MPGTRSSRTERSTRQVPESIVSSHSSKLSSRSAKAKFQLGLAEIEGEKLLADLERQRLADKADLERQRLADKAEQERQRLADKAEQERQRQEDEVRSRIEIARLSMKLSDELELSDAEACVSERGSLKSERITSYLEDCKQQLREEDTTPHHRPVEVESPKSADIMFNAHHLPKVELQVFDGDVSKYWRFIRQFEEYVERRVVDPGQRFLYIQYYCRGAAREAIEDLSLLSPSEAYHKARETLRELFGLPHVLARARLDDLLDHPRIRVNDADALMRFAIKMRGCEVALTQMKHTADMNAMHTLEGVVKLLPPHLQREWCKRADVITMEVNEPGFSDLQQFITNSARVARSRFGQLVNDINQKGQPTVRPTRPAQDHERTRSFYLGQDKPNIVKPKLNCPFCEAPHTPPACKQFTDASTTVRWEMVRYHSCCFVCLEPGHRTKDCQEKGPCGIENCRGLHHPMLHSYHDRVAPSNAPITTHCGTTSIRTSALLGIIPITVRTPNKTIQTYALLDDGSDCTLITNELLHQLDIASTSQSLTVVTATGSSEGPSKLVSFEIGSLDGSEWIQVDKAFSVSSLPIRPPPREVVTGKNRWPHLNDVTLNYIENETVGLLIGIDIPEAHWVLDQRLNGRKQPYAVKTLLGWVLRGPLGLDGGQVKLVNCIQREEDPLIAQMKYMYDAEFSNSDTVDSYRSIQDAKAEEIVSSSCKHVDGKYVISLPWKEKDIRLPNNRGLAVKRLMSLKARLVKDIELRTKYSTAITDMVLKGYAEPALSADMTNNIARNWYIPHHAVFHPRKPGKLRVVLDCAAETNGQSLNKSLLQGPDLTCDLVIVMLRFRGELVGVAADIEEMFMQVHVATQDRTMLRFLWWKDGDFDQELVEYQMTAHPFGATSSPFCATYALQQTIRDYGHLYNPATKTAALGSFYVDDCLASFPSTSEAEVFITDACSLLSRGGFRLRKWVSSHPCVLDVIPASERAHITTVLPNQMKGNDRMLGIEWDAVKDIFRFTIQVEDRSYSRRTLLSMIASIYDPLGLLGPLILPAKIVLQDLCRKSLGWDDPLPPEDTKRIRDWRRLLDQCGPIEVTRCLRRDEEELIKEPELHIFADASESAYGAACYALYQTQSDSYWSLVYAKCRVAPIKTVTIPRLELTAASLATRLQQTVTKALGFGGASTTYWTDSMTVLYYIKNSAKRFPTFVANRVATICRTTMPTQWRHIRSEANPADVASRGVRTREDWIRWNEGPVLPDVLNEASQHVEVDNLIEALELREVVTMTTRLGLGSLLHYHSNWPKLLRSVAWLRRFKQWIISRSGLTNQNIPRGYLSRNEITEAENDVLRLVQLEVFGPPSEANRTFKSDSLLKLRPIVIDGLIRVGGRLEYTTYGQTMKHPVILPSDHPVVDAIIRHFHLYTGHSGPAYVLTSIRKSYWIVNGLRAVKRILRLCIHCRKASASPMQQIMAPLPVARSQSGWFPFKFVGVDFFGPLTVKRGRALVKRYGCLFTCMQIRAVHLELTSDLSTDVFIMALMRFIGRRGCPSHIYSDNGTNFVGAVRELREQVTKWDTQKIVGTGLTHMIQWHFNPPYSSHRGGVWERLIRSVRKVLLSITTNQTMSEETLSTLFVQTESIVNGRPLFPPSSDCRDRDPLSPNDLLLVGGERFQLSESDLEQRYYKKDGVR